MKEYIVQAIERETIESFDAHNAPELIRCRDCVKRKSDKCLLYWNEIMDDETWNDNWFCADGVAKDEVK